MTEKEKVFGELFLRMLYASETDEGVKLNDEEANLLFGKLVEMIKNLTEENKQLEHEIGCISRAHKANIKIAEYALEDKSRYKKALEEIDEEFETILHYGFEGSDHLWRTRKVIEKALGNEEEQNE